MHFTLWHQFSLRRTPVALCNIYIHTYICIFRPIFPNHLDFTLYDFLINAFINKDTESNQRPWFYLLITVTWLKVWPFNFIFHLTLLLNGYYSTFLMCTYNVPLPGPLWNYNLNLTQVSLSVYLELWKNNFVSRHLTQLTWSKVQAGSWCLDRHVVHLRSEVTSLYCLVSSQ